MIETGIAELLLASPAVTALIGTRLFPVTLPAELDVAGLGPCLTYQVITASSDFTVDKKKEDHKRIQFDAFAGKSNTSGGYSQAKAVLQAVSTVLDTFVGKLPDGTRIIFAQSSIEIDNFENDSRVYRCLCEYEISFSSN